VIARNSGAQRTHCNDCTTQESFVRYALQWLQKDSRELKTAVIARNSGAQRTHCSDCTTQESFVRTAVITERQQRNVNCSVCEKQWCTEDALQRLHDTGEFCTHCSDYRKTVEECKLKLLRETVVHRGRTAVIARHRRVLYALQWLQKDSREL